MVRHTKGRERLSRRRFLVATGATGATAGLAGCGSLGGVTGSVAGNVETTVQFWTLFSGGDGEAMEAIVDRFNDEQPIGNVTIERQRIPWGNYYTKLYTALVADRGPDIAIMHQALMGRFQDVLVPFDPFLSESAADQYVPTLWERMRFEGQQLALPLDAHPVGLYHNRSIFEEAGLDPNSPPTNFEEFESVCNTIMSETDASPFAPMLDPSGMLRVFIAFDRQRGGQMFNEDFTQTRFGNQAGMGVARLFSRITGEYGWDIPNTTPVERADIAFQDGNLAMTINGSWYAPVLQGLDGFDWGMYKPFVAPDKQADFTEAGSHTIVMPQKSNRSEGETRTATQAAEWITQENPTWGTVAGHLPAAADLLGSQELRDSLLWPRSLSTFSEMANNDQFTYLPRTPFNINEPSTWNFLLDIYSHNVGPEAGIERGVNSIQDLISDVN